MTLPEIETDEIDVTEIVERLEKLEKENSEQANRIEVLKEEIGDAEEVLVVVLDALAKRTRDGRIESVETGVYYGVEIE